MAAPEWVGRAAEQAESEDESQGQLYVYWGWLTNNFKTKTLEIAWITRLMGAVGFEPTKAEPPDLQPLRLPCFIWENHQF
jgi:hypothetical protein